MLRVHFSGADLARTRLAPGPVPIWETVLSLHRFQRGDGGPQTARWRRQVRGTLPRDWSLLASLVPPRGYFPDFLTPAATDLGTAIEDVASTSRDIVRRDLAHLPSRAVTGFARELWRGTPSAFRALGTALTGYHRTALAPYWHRIEQQVRVDRTRLVDHLATGGVEGLLTALPPTLRWRSPTLEVDYPVDQDLVLDGRGLLLVPSFFCHLTGVTLLHDDNVPVLVYPVEQRSSPGSAHSVALARLLGHSRAAVLQSLEMPGTTGEVAGRAGVLISSASQHLAALRDARLVHTSRHGRTARHTLTTLGAALLSGAYDLLPDSR
jgi:DNA-binding transcriptional ArsR family regulator